ncbi:MAG: transcriptional regulator [Planctomycetes bacterium RIFCSPHIGHO2_12_FULL_52_36]|nr:MAG: transcriptional regulator [Planctomycetes bacterium RIFCSPHIGHO2_02_FULL_52_58]OHB93598.1 MAG: transcriptional regulator [Planctomycetes bacterium RIFCSPHIGHO2_12_FULL_52_36]
MPEISRFYGISIYMYFREHKPPHFHAVYGENGALISIETLGLVSGWLPPRVMGLVVEWASLHKEELKRNWGKACNHQKPDKIEPLK